MSEGETAERALQYLNPLLKIQRIGFAGARLFEEFECVNHVISALTSHPEPCACMWSETCARPAPEYYGDAAAA
jgi:hypothetical protein